MSKTVNRKELWEIIKQSKTSNRAPPDCNKVINTVCSILGVINCDAIKQIIENEIRYYKKYMAAQQGTSSSKRKDTPDENTIIFNEEDFDQIELPSQKKRRHSKDFELLSPFRKREHTEEILKVMKSFLDDENAGRAQPFTIRILLGYLLYRTEYHSGDKKLAELGMKIMNDQDITEPHTFDVTDAVTLMHDLTLSKEQMRVMKNYINSKGMYFPNTNQILQYRKKIKPEIKPLNEFEPNPSDLPGVAVNYKDLIKETTASIIDVINDQPLNPQVKYRAYYKDGADGAGSQAIWKSKSMKDAAPNIYQYSIVPLRMEVLSQNESKIIWKNPAPNSAFSCRPQELFREKEDNCMHHSIPYTDRSRTELMEESVAIVSHRRPEIAYQVEIVIHDTMKDMKFKKLLSGQGGADCMLCIFPQSSWMSVEQINNGFPITITSDFLHRLYNQLATAEGDIPKKEKDYEERFGLTQEPITSSDQHSVAVTHSYINGTSWFVKLLARINAEYFQWIEKSTCYGDHIRAGTNRVKDILEETGLRVAGPSGPLGKGGGSIDGNTGRRFFDEKSLPCILNCVDEKYHENLKILHKNMSVILRIISATDSVNVAEFQELLKETSLHIATAYPWVKINYTLHGVLHHAADLIIMNERRGLGDLSEEALEANNKYVRRFLELYSRKNSPMLQLEDVQARLLERSDPYILDRKLNFRPKKKICIHCQSTKHSSKGHSKAINMNSYDLMVQKYLVSTQI